MDNEMFSWEVKTEKKRIVYSKMRLLNKIVTGMDETLMKDELSSLDIRFNASLNNCRIIASGLQSRVLKQIPQGKYKYYSIAPLLNKNVLNCLNKQGFYADTFYHNGTDDYCFLISGKGILEIEEIAWEIQRIVQEIMQYYVLSKDSPFCVTTVYSPLITDYNQIEEQFQNVLKIKSMDFFEMKAEVRSEDWLKIRQKKSDRLFIEKLIQHVEKSICLTNSFEIEQAVDTLFEVLKKTLNMEIVHDTFSQIALSFLKIQSAYFNNEDLIEFHFDSNSFSDISAVKDAVKQEALILAEKRMGFQTNRSMVIQEAIYLINLHYQDGINQKEIAEIIGVTPQYLSHLFNQEMKMGIPAYVNQLRIEKAKHLLLNTDLKAEQIIKMIGVSSLNQFYRLFKKHENCTVMEYRHRHQG